MKFHYLRLFYFHTNDIIELFYNDPLYYNVLSIIIHLNDIIIDFADLYLTF